MADGLLKKCLFALSGWLILPINHTNAYFLETKSDLKLADLASLRIRF